MVVITLILNRLRIECIAVGVRSLVAQRKAFLAGDARSGVQTQSLSVALDRLPNEAALRTSGAEARNHLNQL